MGRRRGGVGIDRHVFDLIPGPGRCQERGFTPAPAWSEGTEMIPCRAPGRERMTDLVQLELIREDMEKLLQNA